MENIPKKAIAGVLAVVIVLGIFVLLAISAGGETLTEERAKAIVLESAGVLEADATFTRVEYEEEDGRPHYEVSFYTAGMEYEYEVDEKEGAVLKSQHKLKTDDIKDASASQRIISENTAKEKALAHAGLKDDEVKFTEVKVDDDNEHYEVEFVYQTTKYEYEIDLFSGKVLSAESEEIKAN